MKYAVAYKADDNWVFLRSGLSKDFPCGIFGTGMRRFDTLEEAAQVLRTIVLAAGNAVAWATTLRVVTISDAAVEKYAEARELLKKLDDEDRAKGLRGNDSMLFKRGREVGELSREANQLMLAGLRTI